MCLNWLSSQTIHSICVGLFEQELEAEGYDDYLNALEQRYKSRYEPQNQNANINDPDINILFNWNSKIMPWQMSWKS